MAEANQAGPIGRPLERVDGPCKVTGKATYAFEYAKQGEVAYGFIVPAGIGKAASWGWASATRARTPGVLLVVTKDNAPSQAPCGPMDLPDRFARATQTKGGLRCPE